MTGQDDAPDSDARRSFMKKSALATGAIALGSAGTAAGQQDDTDDEVLFDEAGGKALITVDNFHPQGRFTFVSGAVDWSPRVPDVQDSLWSEYNTYQVRWLGTNEIVPLWVAADAQVGEYDEDAGFVTDLEDGNGGEPRPQVWQMNQQWTPLGDNPALITVQFEPLTEEEEEAVLTDDWWWGEDDAGNETEGGGAVAGNETEGGGAVDGNDTDGGLFGDDGNDSDVGF